MLILTGPAGSGKTFLALQQLREAIRLHDDSVRLLVPTATMAAHLRNELAREGLVVRPSLIQTLWRFIERWVSEIGTVEAAGLVQQLAELWSGREQVRAGLAERLPVIKREAERAGALVAADFAEWQRQRAQS